MLTGQSIDRALFDHVNSYTGETGSDGVVRAAAANLNCSYVRLQQDAPTKKQLAGNDEAICEDPVDLSVEQMSTSQPTAFALIRGRSHSGDDMGILRSVPAQGGRHPSVDAALRCIMVDSDARYRKLCNQFKADNKKVMDRERVEVHDRFLLPDTYTLHDAHSMVIVRIADDRGYALDDFDLKLTAGPQGSPDLLPKGFFVDRQRNKRHAGTVTYFLNHDVMVGSPAIRRRIGAKTKKIRPKQDGATHLGFEIIPRPREGYTHFLRAVAKATVKNMKAILAPHQTTLIDVVLRRVVRQGVFELTTDQQAKRFDGHKRQPPRRVIP